MSTSKQGSDKQASTPGQGAMSQGAMSDIDQRTEALLHSRSLDLDERTRELDFLYGMVKIIERPEGDLQEKIAGALQMLPQAWSNPELIHARLRVDQNTLITPGFRELPIKHVAQVKIRSKVIGHIEVFSTDRELLNVHKRNLIEEMTDRLGMLIERERALQELVEQQRFIRNVTDASPDIIYIFDIRQQRNIYVSNHIAAYLGYSANEIAEWGSDFLADLLHPDDLAQVDDLLARWETASDDELLSVDYRMRDCDGNWRWFTARDKVFKRDDDGKVLQIVGTAQDVTERVHAEKEASEVTEKAQQAQKLEGLGVLAGGIAHDFNNLLTSILGNAELALKSMSHASNTRVFVDEIIKATRRGAELCHQMLTYAGRGNVETETVDLALLVKEMAEMLKVSISKKIVLRRKFDSAQVLVRGDATQIRQVIMNLITNASEAIGDQVGEIRIETGVRLVSEGDPLIVEEQISAGAYSMLSVSDTGEGMDDETQRRIFDPFFTTKFTGRGLGLAAVIGIMRSHDGFIQIVSQPGRGSVFQVFFPLIVDSPPQLTQDPVKAVPLRGKGTVLVADDEAAIRSVTRLLLEQLGFDVIEACDGSQAIDQFRAAHRDLVLVMLDWTMPNLDGSEALREITRISDLVPVLVTSGYAESEVADGFAGQNVAGYLQKPYRFQALEDAIRGVLAQRCD